MSDRAPDSGDDTDLGPDRGSRPRLPRWVKAWGIIGGVLVLLLVAVLVLTPMIFGDDEFGPHGPGHGPGGEAPAVEFEHPEDEEDHIPLPGAPDNG